MLPERWKTSEPYIWKHEESYYTKAHHRTNRKKISKDMEYLEKKSYNNISKSIK